MMFGDILPDSTAYGAMAIAAAIGGLLIEKGIITQEEFQTATDQAVQMMRDNDPMLKALKDLDESLGGRLSGTHQEEAP